MIAETLRDLGAGFREGFREAGRSRLARRAALLGVLLGGTVAIYTMVRLTGA